MIHVGRLTAALAVASFWANEALAGWVDSVPGTSPNGGNAPEIDGPAGLTAIALVACVGLYLYNRYRR